MIRIIATTIVIPALLFGESAQEVKQRAKEFAKSQMKTVESTFQNYDRDLFPQTNFNSEEAKYAIKFGAVQETEASQLARQAAKNVSSSLHQEDSIFNISDKLAENQVIDEPKDEITEGFTYEKCYQSGPAYPISYVRILDVEVTKPKKICRGHRIEKKYFWKNKAQEEAEKQEVMLLHDKTIQSYKVEVEGNAFRNYTVVIEYTHNTDAFSCVDYKIVQIPEEVDAWTYDNSRNYELAKTLNCTFTHAKCLDAASPKIIKGRQVSRKCWMEELHFICQNPKKDTCGFLKDRRCTLIEKKCLQETDAGCALWELLFKCGGVYRYKPADEKIAESSEPEQLEEGPGRSFSEVYTTLQVFNEMNNEIQSQPNIVDGNLQVFKGLERKCARSLSSELMYDCCSKMRGLATELKLAKCNADELDLAEMRERGFCHYIGKYEERFLDLWKSRDNHVFCCFSSKLYRVLHEEIRDQIGLGWGTPENPLCRGLTIEEVSKADFSKLNLGEAFSDLAINREENSKRLDSFANRLKESLKSEKI
jgi:conjugal transfer mating pair stabilization protein TraN